MCDYKMNYTAFKKSSGVEWQDKHLPTCKLKRQCHCPIWSHGFLYPNPHCASSRVRKLRYAQTPAWMTAGFFLRYYLQLSLRDYFIVIPALGCLFPATLKATLFDGVVVFDRSRPCDLRADSYCTHILVSAALCWVVRTPGWVRRGSSPRWVSSAVEEMGPCSTWQVCNGYCDTRLHKGKVQCDLGWYGFEGQ